MSSEYDQYKGIFGFYWHVVESIREIRMIQVNAQFLNSRICLIERDWPWRIFKPREEHMT